MSCNSNGISSDLLFTSNLFNSSCINKHNIKINIITIHGNPNIKNNKVLTILIFIIFRGSNIISTNNANKVAKLHSKYISVPKNPIPDITWDAIRQDLLNIN